MRRWICCLLWACSSAPAEEPAKPAPAAPQQSELDRALDQLAAQILERVSDTKKTKVAVNEFLTLKGEATDLGKFMAEELATRLIRSGKTQVVERRLLQKVLSEQEIGASQLVDDETAARVGKLLGADTLCVGTLTDLGSEIKVNARLINAETAEVYGAASTDLPKKRAVLALLGGSSGEQRPAIISGPAPDRRPTRARKDSEPEPVQQAAVGPSRPAVTVGSQQAVQQASVSVSTAAPVNPGLVQVNTADMAMFLDKSPFLNAPDVVMVHNKSPYCVKFWVNGRVLKIFNGSLEVPCAPAKSKAFVRVPAFGEYRVQASGSTTPYPFKGVVAYQKDHVFSHETKKKVVVLQAPDFYAINP